MTDQVKIRTAIACEMVRHEADGKIFAIGILNPIFGRTRPSTDQPVRPMSLRFLISLDFPSEGDFDFEFRLRPLKGKVANVARLEMSVSEGAKNVPLPVGPLRVNVGLQSPGFILDHRNKGGRWREIARWRIDWVDLEKSRKATP